MARQELSAPDVVAVADTMIDDSSAGRNVAWAFDDEEFYVSDHHFSGKIFPPMVV